MRKVKRCANCGDEFQGRGKFCSYVCGADAMFQANKQIEARKGPIYEKWKTRWEAATGLKMKGEG